MLKHPHVQGDAPPLMSADEAARLFSVSSRTVRRHLASVRIGRRQMFRRADVEALINGEPA